MAKKILMLCLALVIGIAFAVPAMAATVNNPMTENLDGGGYNISNVADITAKGPEVDVRAYASFAAAIDAINTDAKTLLIPNQQDVTANKTVPLNVTLRFLQGGSLNISTGVTVTINGHIDAELYQIFKWTGTGNVVFGLGAVKEVYPEWWGFGAAGYGAPEQTINSVSIQAAIDSNAPIIRLPNGTYAYNTGLTIDRAIRFDGAGSSGADSNQSGQRGASTTLLNYTGAGIGITLVGSGTEGKENIHLSNFSLWGTASGAGGIIVGSSGLVSKSSIKNVHVRAFNQTGAYGLRLKGVLESYLENVYTQLNYDGIVNLAGDVATTIRTKNVHSRANTRYGTYLTGTFSGCDISSLLNEGNGYAGLRIDGSGVINVDFHSYYSEANNQTGGTAPIEIGLSGGTTVSIINFFGGGLFDAVAGRSIDMDRAGGISFHNISLTTFNSGFMRITANTTFIEFDTLGDIYSSYVTGNHLNGARVNNGDVPSKWTKTIAKNGVVSLPYTGGILIITDTTNNKSAIYFLNGSAGTVNEVADPGSGFWPASGHANTINIYYYAAQSIYSVQNSTGASATLSVSILNGNGY